VVTTNHYVTPGLQDQWTEHEPPDLMGNSQARYARVRQALQDASGRMDLGMAQELMSSHGQPLEAICRHPEIDPRSGTIASMIFRPRLKTTYLAAGLPCQTSYQAYSLDHVNQG
jgi:hypothetical protein